MSILTMVSVIGLPLAAYATSAWSSRLHPSTAARFLTLVTVLASVSGTAWLVVVAGAFLVHTAGIHTHGGHLVQLLAAHGPVPPWLGVAAVTTLAVGAVVAGRETLAMVRERRAVPPGEGILVVDEEAFVAMAVPGRRERIVVSQGLLERLPPSELAVVFAHERAHLRHHHSTFAALVTLAASLSPWLRPAKARLPFLLERWADEDAARVVGDRRTVAAAISRVALGPTGTSHGLAFSGGSVVARVKAMLDGAPPTATVRESIAVASTSAAAAGMAGTALQLHHAVGFLG